MMRCVSHRRHNRSNALFGKAPESEHAEGERQGVDAYPPAAQAKHGLAGEDLGFLKLQLLVTSPESVNSQAEECTTS